MSKKYIITLTAANRVGILAAVTTAMDELGGDVQEVSQTVLQKFFTIILAARFPEHREQQVIVDHIRDVCRPYGIEVCLKDPEQETLMDEPESPTEKYFLTVTGQDQPGIMRQISSRLAQDEIDITDLYAVSGNAEHSFVMVMELSVSADVDTLSLQTELEKLGKSIGMSAVLKHESIFAATNEPHPLRASLLKSRADIEV